MLHLLSWKPGTFTDATKKDIVAGLHAWSHRSTALKGDSMESSVNVGVTKKEK